MSIIILKGVYDPVKITKKYCNGVRKVDPSTETLGILKLWRGQKKEDVKFPVSLPTLFYDSYVINLLGDGRKEKSISRNNDQPEMPISLGLAFFAFH